MVWRLMRSSWTRTVALVSAADRVRPEAAEAIRVLRADGLEIVMLTGDNRLAAEVVARAVAEAEAEAGRSGVIGPAVTPFVLARVADATEGRSLPANLALAEHNASVAAEIAAALCELA